MGYGFFFRWCFVFRWKWCYGERVETNVIYQLFDRNWYHGVIWSLSCLLLVSSIFYCSFESSGGYISKRVPIEWQGNCPPLTCHEKAKPNRIHMIDLLIRVRLTWLWRRWLLFRDGRRQSKEIAQILTPSQWGNRLQLSTCYDNDLFPKYLRPRHEHDVAVFSNTKAREKDDIRFRLNEFYLLATPNPALIQVLYTFPLIKIVSISILIALCVWVCVCVCGWCVLPLKTTD